MLPGLDQPLEPEHDTVRQAQTQRHDQHGQTQSLYRKYRPVSFDTDELVGQEHVTRTLRNAIARGRVAHAYLFCGPRGTGKTSTARLLAKAINCEDPEVANRPCNACTSCIAINQARTTDVIEIDAASNRGIDDIRNLREQVKYAPTQLRSKFYIIDEAHRLTRDGFNAFLKTLEEPPPNTVFVLATTDPDDLPDTIASRCQRFDFRRIPFEPAAHHVRSVCEREGIAIDDEALAIVVRQATGSLRDALGTIDLLASAAAEYGDGTIDAALARQMLGISPDQRAIELAQAIADREVAAGLRVIAEALDAGQDMRSFGRQVLSLLRVLMLVNAGADPPEATDDVRALAGRFDLSTLLHVNRQFAEVDFAIRNGGFPQLPLELALVGSIVTAGQERGARNAERGTRGEPRGTVPPVSNEPRERMQARSEPVVAPQQPVDRMARATPSPVQQPAPQNRPAPTVPAAPRAQPAPQADMPIDDSSVDRIRAVWDRIRTEVKVGNIKVEALLAATDPARFDGHELTLVATYPFHAGKLNEPKPREIIELAIERVLGLRVHVTTVLRDELSPATPARPAGPAPMLPTTNGSHAGEPPATYDAGDSESDEPKIAEDSIFGLAKAILDAEEV